MEKTAIIIGAGIGGIASAIRLAASGFSVQVFEKNKYPGGKLTEIEVEGFRFDAGPSLFTMPSLVEELFELVGENPKDHFQYEQLEIVCKYFFEDGVVLNAYADSEKYISELEDKLKIDGALVEQHFQKSEEIYNITAKIFMESSLHKSSTFLNVDTFKAALKLPKINAHLTMNAYNEKMLKNEKLVQLFNRYATYNGSDPYQAPATLNIIPHLEQGIGAFFPKGGMHTIIKSLFELAKSLGVEFVFESVVNNILVEDKTAIGIETTGQQYFADFIISNMDVYHTYKKLLLGEKHPNKILNQEKSSSALIFYWGIKNTFPELELHNIFFSESYRKEFEYIFQEKNIFNDPTVYLNISSKHNRSDAPNNCENWFVMINVPNNTGQDWETLINLSRKNILQKLSKILKQEIEPLIQCEEILDPRTIESKTSSHLGALYGNSSNSKMAAFFRHANFSNKIDKLFFCGGSVHPGGGIPLCLYSAKILVDIINERTNAVG